MADGFIIVPPDSTGKKMDTTELVVGANTVERERVNIADGVAAAQIATVTAANALKVDGSAVTQPVSGTVTSNQGGAPWSQRVQDGVGATLATVTAANALKVDGSAVTQPVSGTVTSNQGGAPWTARVQDGVGATLATVTAGNAVKVDGSAVTQPVSGTVTGNQGTAAANTAGWPVTGGIVARGTASWTSVTAVNTTLAATVTGYSTVVVALNQGTTITAGVVTFEASDDNTNWYALQGVDSSAFTAAGTYTLQASTLKAWEFDIGGFTNFRVRLSTAITGTGTVAVGLNTQQAAADPAVTVGQSAAASLNCTAVLAAGAATIGALTANQSVNVSQFGGTNVVTGTGASGVGIPRVTLSNDSSLAANQSSNIAQINAVTPLMGNGVTGTGSLRVTVASDNTAFSVNNTPPANQSMNLAQVAGTGTVTGGVAGSQGVAGLAASGAAKAGNPNQVGHVFNTTQPTVTTGQVVEAQATARGALIVATGVDALTITPSGTQTVAGTVTANQGTPAATANRWPVQITDGTNLATVTAAGLLNVSSSAAPAADTVGTTSALGALNATAQVTLAGQAGVGMFLASGTLIGTVVPEISYDGGTTWVASLFYDPAVQTTSVSLVFGAANAATTRTVLTGGGTSQARVRVSAFTSGTANATLRGTGTQGGVAVTSFQGSAPWTQRLQDGAGATLATVTAANALKVDGSAVTQPVSLAAAVDVSDRAARLVGQVEGRAASGAAKAGNPVQIGGVFNTAQPTVTTGQAVEYQATARGAGIVATGVDVFNVTVNAALPTGANVIGALSANQSVNVAQIAGTAASTAAAGTQKVGITGNTAAAIDAAQNAAAPANELVVGGVFNTTIPALTAGNASQIQVDSTGAQQVDIEGRKATYSAFASFTPVAGDIAVLPGSATKTIRAVRVEVSLSTSGTAAIGAVQLVKRSTADTAGTSAAMTAVPHDSNFAAASAAPLRYTAAPTLGTAVGTMRGVQFSDASSALPGANTWIWTFGDGRGGATATVLRGTAQELCVNLGAVVATQTATVSFEWTEE